MREAQELMKVARELTAISVGSGRAWDFNMMKSEWVGSDIVMEMAGSMSFTVTVSDGIGPASPTSEEMMEEANEKAEDLYIFKKWFLKKFKKDIEYVLRDFGRSVVIINKLVPAQLIRDPSRDRSHPDDEEYGYVVNYKAIVKIAPNFPSAAEIGREVEKSLSGLSNKFRS